MSNELFIINYSGGIYALYIDLEKAKSELKNIYNRTPDYKAYGFIINVYNLDGNEYKNTNVTYMYVFDAFSKNITA